MSFFGALAPLYLAGLAAIALPLIFHLIRKTPSGEQPFSSLMFLQPSPPRLTKRSLLDNLLLLLLRALVIALLAFAFTRPLWRNEVSLDLSGVRNRQIAILIDTSASMQRDGAWSSAVQEVEKILGDLEQGDQVGLYAYDETLRTVVDLADTPQDLEDLQSLCRSALIDLEPSWRTSRLPQALIQTSDRLIATSVQTEKDSEPLFQLFVVSDMQTTQAISELQGFEWPKQLRLSLRPVTPSAISNAGIRLLTSEATTNDAENSNRIRITNSSESQDEQFSVQWLNEKSDVVAEESYFVPAGESRAFRPTLGVREQAEINRLRLLGDRADFDNTFYVAQPVQRTMRVAFIGDNRSTNDKQDSLDFFLANALIDNRQRRFEFERWSNAEVEEKLSKAVSKSPSATELDWLVIASPLSRETRETVRSFAEAGGRVLVVLTEEFAGKDDLSDYLNEEVTVSLANVRGYQILGQIEFQNPVFAPFADRRFSDFTGIHFWQHRSLKFERPKSEWSESIQILARFDNGEPYLLETTLGDGALHVMTSGWETLDSQLALSTKFVPLMAGLANDRARQRDLLAFNIGDTIALPSTDEGSEAKSIINPNGDRTKLAKDATLFRDTDMPGIYTFEQGDFTTMYAVNVDAKETETMPFDTQALETFGVELGDHPNQSEQIDWQRSLKDKELEGRQKLWAWLLIAALLLVLSEMFVAGRIQNKQVASS